MKKYKHKKICKIIKTKLTLNRLLQLSSNYVAVFSVSVGNKHPDPVVETSSLSSVESSDIWYKLSIPESTIDYGDLSALQLESIVYASQRHSIILPCGERAGFLVGML